MVISNGTFELQTENKEYLLIQKKSCKNQNNRDIFGNIGLNMG